MPKEFRSLPGLKQKKAKQGDVSSLVRIDNPDDAEIAAPLGAGDDNTLVKIDNPDDADIYGSNDQRYAKPKTGSNLNQKQPQQPKK
jgi:hypothetical protein